LNTKLKNTTIIIPVYNEVNTIVEIITRCLAVAENIIIVDDCSNDGTKELVQKKFPHVTLLSYDRHKGKGYALRFALKECNTDWVAFQDADLEYSPEALVSLQNIAIEVAVGVRSLNLSDIYRKITIGSFLANKMFAYLLDTPDPFSAQRIIKTSIIKGLNLKSNGFQIETELTIKLKKFNTVYGTVPYKPRTKDEGKKIGFKDFIKIIIIYIRTPR